MARYSYRCPDDGRTFDLVAPIGTAAARQDCPTCGGGARRLITAPMLSLAPKAFVLAHDEAARSAHEPSVVNALPAQPRRRRAVADIPALQRLPRP